MTIKQLIKKLQDNYDLDAEVGIYGFSKKLDMPLILCLKDVNEGEDEYGDFYSILKFQTVEEVEEILQEREGNI